MLLKIIISIAVSYIIGAIPFSFIIGKINGHDVRKEGSCNPGASNVLRVCGKKAGILAYILDIGKGMIAVNDHVAEVLPMVTSDESVDAFMLNLNYYGYSWMNINEIVFKIGDNRYFFTSDQGPINARQEVYSNGMVQEQLMIVFDANSLSFMQDFIEHRDEEILVRFSGADSVMDFALTKEIKDATIGLYDRYVMAGGTQPESLQTVTDLHCIKMQVLNREV